MGFSEKFPAIADALRALLTATPKLLILGIGETRMGDDGAGSYISFNLYRRNHLPQVKIINGGIVPEERLAEILAFQPQLIIVIDAVNTGDQPGTVRLLEEKSMLNYLPVSSHSMPLPVFIDRIKQNLPQVRIKLLGTCPFSMAFLDHYVLFYENQFSLDDKDGDLNIPFYAFNLTPQMAALADEIVADLDSILKESYGQNTGFGSCCS